MIQLKSDTIQPSQLPSANAAKESDMLKLVKSTPKKSAPKEPTAKKTAAKKPAKKTAEPKGKLTEAQREAARKYREKRMKEGRCLLCPEKVHLYKVYCDDHGTTSKFTPGRFRPRPDRVVETLAPLKVDTIKLEDWKIGDMRSLVNSIYEKCLDARCGDTADVTKTLGVCFQTLVDRIGRKKASEIRKKWDLKAIELIDGKSAKLAKNAKSKKSA